MCQSRPGLLGPLFQGDLGALDGESAARLNRLPDRCAQLALQLVRRVVSAALPGQQLLELLVDAILLEARRGGFEVPAQFGLVFLRALPVEQEVDLRKSFVASDLAGVVGDVHQPTFSCLPARMKPRSRATS